MRKFLEENRLEITLFFLYAFIGLFAFVLLY